MINNDNIELYLFRYKEGLLSDDERKAVEKALSENAAWRELCDLYDPLLKAPSYPAAGFPDKESLRAIAKAKPKATVISLWRKISVAASISLIIGVIVSLFKISNTPNNPVIVSELESEVTELTSEPSPATRQQDIIIEKSRSATHIYHKKAIATKELSSPVNNEVALIDAEKQIDTRCQPEKIIVTDKLITFIDDDTTDTFNDFESIEIMQTERLITYIDPISGEDAGDSRGDASSRPEWTYAIEDWWNSIRLSQIEKQTEIINLINNYR